MVVPNNFTLPVGTSGSLYVYKKSVGRVLPTVGEEEEVGKQVCFSGAQNEQPHVPGGGLSSIKDLQSPGVCCSVLCGVCI